VPTRQKAVTRDEGDPAITPRLLDLHSAARYCGLSYWSLRDFVLQGRIRPVPMPPLQPRPGERRRRSMRRVLIDRNELDAWIDSLKR
jgi:hypothetical protein